MSTQGVANAQVTIIIIRVFFVGRSVLMFIDEIVVRFLDLKVFFRYYDSQAYVVIHRLSAFFRVLAYIYLSTKLRFVSVALSG